jgi:hypothetical protein
MGVTDGIPRPAAFLAEMSSFLHRCQFAPATGYRFVELAAIASTSLILKRMLTMEQPTSSWR